MSEQPKLDPGARETDADSSPALRRQLRALYGFSFFTYPLAAVPLMWFFYNERGLGLREYGLLVSIGYATMVLFELPTGWLADRVGRRLPMILGPAFFGGGWLLTFASEAMPGFIAGQVAMSLGHALISGPPSALLYEHLDAHGLAHRYLHEESLQWRRVILGSCIAFFLGGSVAHFFGIASAVLLTSLLCFCAIPFGVLVDESERPRRDPATPTSAKSAIKTRIAKVLSDGEVLWLLALFALLFFLLRYSFNTWQPWIEKTRLDGSFFVGCLYASLSLFSLPFTKHTSRIAGRLGDEGSLLWCCALCAAALVGLSFGPSAWLLPLIYFQQLPFALHRPLAHAYANHRIDSRDRALVLSMLSFVGRLGFALTFALVMGDERAIEDDYFTVGLVCLGLTAVLTLARPRQRSA